MIYYHILYATELENTLYFDYPLRIFGFFMFWFFFKAGMYFKPTDNHKEMRKKRYKRLIKPFIIFSIAGQIPYSILLISHGDYKLTHHLLQPFEYIVTTGATKGMSHLWFLSSLFIVSLIFNKLQIIKNGKIYLILLALLPPILYLLQFGRPYWLANIPLGLTFFALGYYLKEFQYKTPVIIFSIAFYTFFQVFFPSAMDFRINLLHYGNYFLYYLVALSGIIAINGIFKHIPYKFPILSYLGRNSLGFYIFHWFVLVLSEAVFAFIGMGDKSIYKIPLLICIASASIVILPLCVELFKRSKYGHII